MSTTKSHLEKILLSTIITAKAPGRFVEISPAGVSILAFVYLMKPVCEVLTYAELAAGVKESYNNQVIRKEVWKVVEEGYLNCYQGDGAAQYSLTQKGEKEIKNYLEVLKDMVDKLFDNSTVWGKTKLSQ